jgi:L-threonylcarbamoyladenylate synthase
VNLPNLLNLVYISPVLLLRVDPNNVTSTILEPAVAALRKGGVVAFPTETFYGLAADPRSSAAVKNLFVVKRRPADLPVPLIAASVAQIEAHIGLMTPLARRLAAAGWPGPLTLVIPASGQLPDDVHLGTGKIAVRVPGHVVARALAECAGHAITSTSANFSGETPPSTADEVAATFGDTIDAIIDAGRTPGGLPSTIVDATGELPVLVRAGILPWKRVLEFLHE